MTTSVFFARKYAGAIFNYELRIFELRIRYLRFGEMVRVMCLRNDTENRILLLNDSTLFREIVWKR
ncbi:MAG: hypothetical protein ACI8U0_001855, partial [Flavobacteriales bacterium]